MCTVGDGMEEVTKSSYQAVVQCLRPIRLRLGPVSMPGPVQGVLWDWCRRVMGRCAPVLGLPDVPSRFRGRDLVRTSTWVQRSKWNYIKLRTVLNGDLTSFTHSIHTSLLPRKVSASFEECHCLFVKLHFQKVNTRKKILELWQANLVSIISTILALWSHGREEFKITALVHWGLKPVLRSKSLL